MKTTSVTWWRETAGRWDRIRGRSQRLGVVVTEVEPGLVHITTEALNELLDLAGFARDKAVSE